MLKLLASMLIYSSSLWAQSLPQIKRTDLASFLKAQNLKIYSSSRLEGWIKDQHTGVKSTIIAYFYENNTAKQIMIMCDLCNTKQEGLQQKSCLELYQKYLQKFHKTDFDKAIEVKKQLQIQSPQALTKIFQNQSKNQILRSVRLRTGGILKCDGKIGRRVRLDFFYNAAPNRAE